MELVLMGVAGCSAIDMISILKKQRQILSLLRLVEGDRVQLEKDSKIYSCCVLSRGPINEEKSSQSSLSSVVF
jgi:putative redox protein